MTAFVLWWDVDRGHGFARSEDGDVFVHYTAIIDGMHCHQWRDELNLLSGQTIEFDPVAGTIGTAAANVRVVA